MTSNSQRVLVAALALMAAACVVIVAPAGPIVGFIIGCVCTWYALRRRAAAYRRDRDYWRDTAEKRAIELKAADDVESLTDVEIGRLRGEVLQLVAEKTELNRLLDAHGVIR